MALALSVASSSPSPLNILQHSSRSCITYDHQCLTFIMKNYTSFLSVYVLPQSALRSHQGLCHSAHESGSLPRSVDMFMMSAHRQGLNNVYWPCRANPCHFNSFAKVTLKSRHIKSGILFSPDFLFFCPGTKKTNAVAPAELSDR